MENCSISPTQTPLLERFSVVAAVITPTLQPSKASPLFIYNMEHLSYLLPRIGVTPDMQRVVKDGFSNVLTEDWDSFIKAVLAAPTPEGLEANDEDLLVLGYESPYLPDAIKDLEGEISKGRMNLDRAVVTLKAFVASDEMLTEPQEDTGTEQRLLNLILAEGQPA